MEEMMDDTLEMQEDDEIEEEADAEVDKVLFELTDGKLGEAGSVGTELPVIGPSLLDSVPAHICDRQHRTHLTLVKRQRSLSTDGSSITYSVDKAREPWTFIPPLYIALSSVFWFNLYSVMLNRALATRGFSVSLGGCHFIRQFSDLPHPNALKMLASRSIAQGAKRSSPVSLFQKV